MEAYIGGRAATPTSTSQRSDATPSRRHVKLGFGKRGTGFRRGSRIEVERPRGGERVEAVSLEAEQGGRGGRKEKTP